MARCGCSTCTRALEGVDVTYRSFLPVEPGQAFLFLARRFALALVGVYREGAFPILQCRDPAWRRPRSRAAAALRNFGRSLCFPIEPIESDIFTNPQDSADLEGRRQVFGST